VNIAFIGVTQFLATITIALARDDPPPSPVRPWAPPALPRYEGELRQYQPTDAERRYLPAIDPRKTYNLAELIDIAQRSNPETRVAWGRARMAAAAVGLTESAYYPYIVAAAAGGYDRAFIPSFRSRSGEQNEVTLPQGIELVRLSSVPESPYAKRKAVAQIHLTLLTHIDGQYLHKGILQQYQLLRQLPVQMLICTP
jgi:hypothetical protein